MASDRELIERYRSGDQDSFAEFYGRHRRPLYVLLLSYARSRETAEELLQETFLAFLGGLDRLDGSDDLLPYLVRTARNLAIDWLRRRRSGERALEMRAADPLFRAAAGGGGDPAAGPPGGAPGDPERVSALLHGLPEEQCEAIVLKVLVGMTFREIAGVTGAPEPTVVSRYRYGLEKIRTALAPGGCR